MPRPADPPPDLARLAKAVAHAVDLRARPADPLERAARLGALLAALHDETLVVTTARDDALVEVLADPNGPSHRTLAGMLGLSRQRIDQLAALTADGGRTFRRARDRL